MCVTIPAKPHVAIPAKSRGPAGCLQVDRSKNESRPVTAIQVNDQPFMTSLW